MYLRRAVERFMAPRSRLTSRNGAVDVAELHLEHLQRIHFVHHLGPAVDRGQVRDQAAGVDGGARGDPLQRGGAGGERQEVIGVSGQDRMFE